MTSELLDAIEFLKHVDPQNISEIKEKMEITLEYRQNLQSRVLEMFPRFIDIPEMVCIK